MRPENKWKHASQTDEELKKVAIALYNNEIFSNKHLDKNDSLERHFMCMLFISPKKPVEPKEKSGENQSTIDKRDNKIYDLLQFQKDYTEYEKAMDEYPFELEDYNEWLNNIGFIYEYYNENQSPMSINGKPVFFSMKLMCKEDTKRMFDFYKKYKEIREEADKF
jgi:hypothetical protein